MRCGSYVRTGFATCPAAISPRPPPRRPGGPGRSFVGVAHIHAIPTDASHAQCPNKADSCVEMARCVSAPAMSVVVWTWEVSVKSWNSKVFSGASGASVLLVQGYSKFPRPGRADESGSPDQTPHRNPIVRSPSSSWKFEPPPRCCPRASPAMARSGRRRR